MSAARESAERAGMLCILISRHSELGANLIASHVCHLQRIAWQAKANATNLCNIPDYQERFDAKQTRLKKAATGALVELSAHSRDGEFKLSLGGDPRGPCAWLTIPGEPGESFSHDEKSYSIY